MSPIGILSGIMAMLRSEGSSSTLLVGEGGQTAKDNAGTGALLGRSREALENDCGGLER